MLKRDSCINEGYIYKEGEGGYCCCRAYIMTKNCWHSHAHKGGVMGRGGGAEWSTEWEAVAVEKRVVLLFQTVCLCFFFARLFLSVWLFDFPHSILPVCF